MKILPKTENLILAVLFFCAGIALLMIASGTVSTVKAGNIKGCIDADDDGVCTAKYEISDSGEWDIEVLEHGDNCPNIFNPLQLGLACKYDVNGDEYVTIEDYNLVSNMADYTAIWYDNYQELPLFPDQKGDMNEDGFITYSDVCNFIFRNPQLGIYLSPFSSCWYL